MSAAGTPEVERTYMPRCGLARADVRAGGSRSRGRTVITRPSRRGRGLEGPIGGRDLPPDAARDARTEPGTGLYGGTTPRRAPQTQPETRFRTWRPCRNSLPEAHHSTRIPALTSMPRQRTHLPLSGSLMPMSGLPASGSVRVERWPRERCHLVESWDGEVVEAGCEVVRVEVHRLHRPLVSAAAGVVAADGRDDCEVVVHQVLEVCLALGVELVGLQVHRGARSGAAEVLWIDGEHYPVVLLDCGPLGDEEDLGVGEVLGQGVHHRGQLLLVRPEVLRVGAVALDVVVNRLDDHQPWRRCCGSSLRLLVEQAVHIRAVDREVLYV